MNRKMIKIPLLLVFLITIIFTFKFLFSTYTINTENKAEAEILYSFKSLDENTLSIKVLETKFNAKKTIENDDLVILKNMLKGIDSSVRIENPNISTQSLFKIYINDDEKKYVIDLYGDDILSLYPWDGTTEKEFISVKKLPNSLNPESICNYIFKN